MLCGFLSLLALSNCVRGRAWWVTGLLAVLAMFSKVTAVTLPCLFVLIDVHRSGGLAVSGFWRLLGRSLLRHAPLFAIAAAFTWAAVRAQREAGAMVATEFLPLPGRLALSFFGAAFCVGKTVWPAGLAPLHQGQVGLTWNLSPFVWWTAAGAAVALVLLVVATWRARRAVPGAILSFAAFLVLIAPAGGLGQSGPQIAAERYTYQPAWVLTFAIGWLVATKTRWLATAGWRAVGTAGPGPGSDC